MLIKESIPLSKRAVDSREPWRPASSISGLLGAAFFSHQPPIHPNRADEGDLEATQINQPASTAHRSNQPCTPSLDGRHPTLAGHGRPCAQSRANHACNENELRLSSIRARVHRRSLLFFVLFPRIFSSRGLHRPSFYFPFHSSFRCPFWGLVSLARTTFSSSARHLDQTKARRASKQSPPLLSSPRPERRPSLQPTPNEAPPTTTHGR